MLYPLDLKLNGRRCLVVGGGRVAWRKVGGLLECGALLTVVSPRLVPEMEALAGEGRFTYLARPYQREDLEGALLVFVASGGREVNRQVARDCRERGILVNVADDPEACDFFLPAVLRRGPLTLGVSSGGLSPLLAGRVRDYLAGFLGPEYGQLAELLGKVRQELLGKFPEQEKRRQVLNRLLDLDLLELLRRGEVEKAKERMAECISSRLD